MQALDKLDDESLDIEYIHEVTEHYRAIIELLSPAYSSVELNADNLSVITIDGKEYNLDDKSAPKLREAVEHRMAIEAILADFDNEQEQIIRQIETQLNKLQ